MDIAEGIVNAWLNDRGHFTISNIGKGENEVDILGVNPKEKRKVHVEVSVSVKPVGYYRVR